MLKKSKPILTAWINNENFDFTSIYAPLSNRQPIFSVLARIFWLFRRLTG